LRGRCMQRPYCLLGANLVVISDMSRRRRQTALMAKL